MILHVGDKYKRIVNVMNDCFGWSYKACYKGWYPLNTYKNSSAWFPKIAILKYGRPVPGDKAYGWCNTMSDDGKYIFMNNFENPELLNKEAPHGDEPHLTFIKLPNCDFYQFAGVYCRRRRDKEHGWIYERVAEDIDTKDYL